MAAPTKPANVKKALANSEPSTHGTSRTNEPSRRTVVIGLTADMPISVARVKRSKREAAVTICSYRLVRVKRVQRYNGGTLSFAARCDLATLTRVKVER